MAERNDITEIRERIDMLELVGAKVQLKRSGKNWKGLCPFHTEKTPSFYVYPDSGNYVCFSCGEKGDAFTWLQKTEGMDFPDALEQLAARTGVTLQRGTVRDPGRDEERERIFAVNEEAATFFASVLLSSPVGEAGRRYVAERGLTRETVERFALGFAPDSWDALLKHLVSHGHREELLAEAGLLTERDDGRRYDRFRGRLMFPIRNRDSRIVGFGGRALGDRFLALCDHGEGVEGQAFAVFGEGPGKDGASGGRRFTEADAQASKAPVRDASKFVIKLFAKG